MKRRLALLLLILWPLGLLHAQGFFLTGFWANQRQIQFSTGAQTIIASLCSGAIGVQLQNAGGTSLNATEDVPVALTTTGSLQFFSDSYCLVPITATTITTGTSAISIYAMNPAVETVTVTVTASGMKPIDQSLTTNTNSYIWKGTTSSNWATGSNWSNGVSAPGAGNVAVLDGTCGPNCSPSFSGMVSVLGIRMNTGYTGTVTQGAQNLWVGTLGFAQMAGTFVGTNAVANSLTVTNAHLGISGGAFTAPAGTMTIHGGWLAYNSPSITVPTNSTVTFDCASSLYTNCYNRWVQVQAQASYENLNLYGRRTAYDFGGGTITVAKNMINGDVDSIEGSLPNGQIRLAGNYTATGTGHPGDATIVLTGNPAGQTVTGNGDADIAGLEIATGTNPVTLSGWLTTNEFRYVSSGPFTTTGSTLDILCQGSSGTKSCYMDTVYVVPGTVTYNNVMIRGHRTTYDLGGGTMTVAGTLTYGDSNSTINGLNNGDIRVTGDVVQSNFGHPGTARIVLTGRPSGQTISGTSTGKIPRLLIAAGTNPVTLSGHLWTYDFDVASVGPFTTTGSILDLHCYANTMPCYLATQPLGLNTLTYNHVLFRGNRTTWDLAGGTTTIAGSLTFGETNGSAYGGINNGTLRAGGNITQTNFGDSGTAVVVVTGNASGQTISGVTAQRFLPLEIDAGANNVTLSGGINTWKYTVKSAGVLVTTGSTLTFSCSVAGLPCRSAGGTITPGNVTYETVNWEGYRTSWDLGGGTLNVSDDFAFGDTGGVLYGGISNGEIRVGGNITMINTGYRGTANIIATGSFGGQIISGNSSGNFPWLTIAAGVNSVTLSGTIRTTGYYRLNSAGSVVTTGSSLEIWCYATYYPCYLSTVSIAPGTVSYNDVTFHGYRSVYDLGGATMTVAGTLTIGDQGSSSTREINNGAFNISKGLDVTDYGVAGSVALNFVGSNSLTVDPGTSLLFPDGNITSNLTGSGFLAFVAPAPFNGTNQKLNIVAGSITMNGYNMTVGGTLTLNAGTRLYMKGGTLSYGALNNSGSIIP